jgi:hypothetical protein
VLVSQLCLHSTSLVASQRRRMHPRSADVNGN